MARAVEVLHVALVARAVGVFRGKGCWSPVFFFCPWEDPSWPLGWYADIQSDSRAKVQAPGAHTTTTALGSSAWEQLLSL